MHARETAFGGTSSSVWLLCDFDGLMLYQRHTLFRSSPKSLLRFTACANKQWSALITSSGIVATHCQRRRPKHSIMLACHYTYHGFADDGSATRLDDRSMPLPSILFNSMSR
ncbi:hypothetical protein DKX38_019185 [Salix brachista]|uniref:Uncharacterized protein n=1 Tax=Salix brachista TaxID=2182728 RepID=A0A5N5KFM3_9ROSI|nr:hypothetical protein DKX38_019185 [Salix brachista]